MGSNAVGQLGLGPEVDSDHTLPILIDVGDDQTTVQSASAGEYHSLVLTDKGEVYAMGHNSNGVLGLGSRCKETYMYEPTSVTFFAPVTRRRPAGSTPSRATATENAQLGLRRRRRPRSGDTEDSDIVLPILDLAPPQR